MAYVVASILGSFLLICCSVGLVSDLRSSRWKDRY